MMVVKANGYLGSEIQNHMSYTSGLVDSMQAVYDIMTRTEAEEIYQNCLDSLELLIKERDACFGGFDEIVALFREART